MGKNQINVALFGLGRIGQMHAENLTNHKSFYLKYTFDINKSSNSKMKKEIKASKQKLEELKQEPIIVR